MKNLHNKIQTLLKTSTISPYLKQMVGILLPVLSKSVLDSLFKTLSNEKKLLTKLDKEKQLAELQFKVLSEKFDKIQKNKTKSLTKSG